MALGPEGMDPALAAQFAGLRRNFVMGLSQRLQDIDSAASPAALHDALHRLTGAAGAYGLDALSQLARAALHATSHQDAAGQAAALAELKHAIVKAQADSVG